MSPEGLSKFSTPGCPPDLSLSSFKEAGSTVVVEGISVSATCQDLCAKHGKHGKYRYIVPETIDDLSIHISYFKYLIYLIFGEESPF